MKQYINARKEFLNYWQSIYQEDVNIHTILNYIQQYVVRNRTYALGVTNKDMTLTYDKTPTDKAMIRQWIYKFIDLCII